MALAQRLGKDAQAGLAKLRLFGAPLRRSARAEVPRAVRSSSPTVSPNMSVKPGMTDRLGGKNWFPRGSTGDTEKI